MAWRHFLVATDGSPAGRHAVTVGESLGRSAGARVTVVTVGPRRSESDRGPNGPPCRPEVRVVDGVPGVEIVRLGERLGADLLILGRNPSPGPDRASLGATADAVIRRSTVPCLLVHDSSEWFRQHLAALDGTDRGLVVYERAQAFQALAGGRLDVVTVQPGEGEGGPRVPTAREIRLRSLLARHRSGTDLIVRQGDPLAAVRGVLHDYSVDVLIVGTHRGGPAGPPDSSGVGRSLLYAAPCAVLTVPL